MARYDSAGFELGNVLAKLTYPPARLRRPGPPPAGQSPDFDPEAVRGSPIRARNLAFQVAENNGRALVAFGPFVGPALVKRIDVTHSNMPAGATTSSFNIWVNTSAYTNQQNIAVGVLPPGVPIWTAARSGDSTLPFADEGGPTNIGQTVNGNRFVIDHYVADAQFFLGIVFVNPTASAGGIFGSLLVYEGVIPSDFPAILG